MFGWAEAGCLVIWPHTIKKHKGHGEQSERQPGAHGADGAHSPRPSQDIDIEARNRDSFAQLRGGVWVPIPIDYRKLAKRPDVPVSCHSNLRFWACARLSSVVMPDRQLAHVEAVDQGQLARLKVIVDQARDYATEAKAPNTRRAYAADWRAFTDWCSSTSLDSLPASGDTVALYLTSFAGTLKTATLQRRLSAISQAHQVAGHETPTRSAAVRLVWAGIRRKHGTAQEGKAPALVEDLRAMMAAMAPRRRGQEWPLLEVRDRALLLLGFAGAFRRSELVSLNVEDLELGRAGIVVHLRRSKADEEGRVRKIGIPRGAGMTCPVAALQAWLADAGIKEGPLFRPVNRHGQLQAGRMSDRAVALVVKRRAGAVGLDPALSAVHTLRAGLATSAAAAGASERAIANQTGHKSMAVLRRYIRDGELFRDNAAAAALGL